MKILVVSDSHNAVFNSVLEALSCEKDVDVIIHCGDKYDDVLKICEALNIDNFYRVPGNCDIVPDSIPKTIMLNLEGKKIMVTHGHLQRVKDNMKRLKREAEEKTADIVLFGHTHIAYEETDNGILYLNPGSPVIPNDREPGYGIVEITGSEVKSKIVKFF